MEDRQPSRVVEDAADQAVVAARRLAASANTPDGFCELGIFGRHRLVGLLLLGLPGLVRLLPGGTRSFLALVACLTFEPCFDEAALLLRRGSGGRGGHHDGK